MKYEIQFANETIYTSIVEAKSEAEARRMFLAGEGTAPQPESNGDDEILAITPLEQNIRTT